MSGARAGRATWSVMVPTYNPTEHLRIALDSVLEAQRRLGEQMQIEIVDDASPEVDVAALVAGWGLPLVTVFRREANGGLAACWNHCVERAAGTLIHLLHQDDFVAPTFYLRMGEAARRFPEAGMLFCRNEFLDERGAKVGELEQATEGLVEDWLTRIASRQRVQCPAVVVRRETYDRIGTFQPTLRYVIDWEMWVRIAAATPVAYLPEPLATYRIHSAAETKRIKTRGIATRDFALGLHFIHRTLVRAGRLDCFALAERFAVESSIYAAQEAESSGEYRAAATEIWASLRYLSHAMEWRRRLRQVKWYIRLLLTQSAQRASHGR